MDILNKTNIQNKILRAPELGDETGGGGASSTPSNAVFIGGVEVDKFYLGNSDDVKIFLGDVKLYPRDISYKLVAQYSDTTEYKVECNSSTSLTQTEVTSHTTPISAMTSAVVSGCVRKIDYNAFNGATSLSSITIDDAVTTLGNQAFYGCGGLTSFNFPSGLTTIEGATFRFANRITDINLPNGVLTLGSGCFADMSGLTAATIPSSVISASTNLFLRDTALKEVHFQGTTPPTLGADAFKDCTSLEKIYIPTCDSYDSYAANSSFSAYTDLIYSENSEKCLQNYKLVAQYSDSSEYKVVCNGSTTLSSGETQGHSSAFNTMTSAVIGDCVTEIGEQAFRGGSSLTSITIPDSVKVIGVGAFHTVTKMTHIDLPSGITTISDSSFRHMQALTAFTIPSGITTIPTWCFNDCTSLTSITIPSNITSLSANCFAYCTALKEVHFKSTTAPTIASNAFSNCTSLEKIYIPSCDNYDAYAAALPNYVDLIYAESDSKCKQEAMPYAMYRVSRNGSATTIACNSSSSNTVTTADTRTGITVASLTSSTATQTPVEIKFGDCCKVISTGACSGWTYLTSVTISDSVTGLSGNYQFLSCKRMKEFKVGNGLKSIGAIQFAYNLGSAYSAQSASNWVDVDFSRTTNLTIGGGSTFAYAYINNLKFGSGVQINGNSCFQNAHINSIKFNGSGSISSGSSTNGKFYMATIGSIDFGSITSIGDYAFSRTSGLTSVSIPNSVTSIGGYIFSGASDITEVTLDYNGNNVGDGIFSNVNSLRKVTFGSHPTKIGDSMFSDCTSLSAVTIPNSITYIGDSAFNTCSSLVSCKLPNNINEIRGYTFYNCTSLTSITIPSSVSTINGYAFSGCTMQYAEILATTPPSLPGTYTFTSTYPIYVPDASVDAYKSAGGDWSQYTSRIKPLSQKP